MHSIRFSAELWQWQSRPDNWAFVTVLI